MNLQELKSNPNAESDALVEAVRAIAFYLPQYHPIPENDEWWGKGFTDWFNVVRARPRYRGHYQPHLPADLGFYDLRVEETREDQARLAAESGIHGFCYYHYWFGGRRLLGGPLDSVLLSGRPDFPFCLCWANETWSRTWSGRDHEVLIKQEYSREDNIEHIDWLADVFCDPRYVRVNGRPLLLIYRPEAIDNVRALVDDWKARVAKRIGSELYLCAVNTGYSTSAPESLIGIGFDAIVNFHPNRQIFPAPRNVIGRLIDTSRRLLPTRWYDRLRDDKLLANRKIQSIINYSRYVDHCIQNLESKPGNVLPCVFPSWDNCARRAAATIIQNNDPDQFARWLRAAIFSVAGCPEQERIVFINAWNEWAEGCHLEPDQRHGKAFLEAARCELQSVGTLARRSSS